jgi:hypothetical protein
MGEVIKESCRRSGWRGAEWVGLTHADAEQEANDPVRAVEQPEHLLRKPFDAKKGRLYSPSPDNSAYLTVDERDNIIHQVRP